MKDAELLQFIHKTCEMGVLGLRDVKDRTSSFALKNAVDGQIREYKRISGRSGQLLRAVGQEPQTPSGMSETMSGIMSAAKLSFKPTDSKIAEMVIQGNSMGITKCTKHLNDYSGHNPQTRDLANKLISTQQANIEQMKPFL